MAAAYAVGLAVRILPKRIEPASIATVPDPLGVVEALPLVEVLPPTSLQVLTTRGFAYGSIKPRQLGKLIGSRLPEGSEGNAADQLARLALDRAGIFTVA